MEAPSTVHRGKKGTKEAPEAPRGLKGQKERWPPPTGPPAPRTHHACSSCPLGSPSTPCSAFGDAPVSSSHAWVPPSYSQESHLWEGVGRSAEGEGRASLGSLAVGTTAEQRRAWALWNRTPKTSPQLTSREDLAVSEIQVQVASTGVTGVRTLGSSGPWGWWRSQLEYWGQPNQLRSADLGTRFPGT